jgi:hypothetical protein
MSDAIVRKQLIALLHGGNAHLTFDEAVAGFPLEQINEPFPNCTYSAWGLLEHIRLTQADILDFMTNPGYQERRWPDDSWPKPGTKATEDDWQNTLDGFAADARDVQRLVLDPATDLYAEIPWGNGQNILREVLIIADHNSHHLGEFAVLRQVLGTWRNDREQFDAKYRQRRSEPKLD